MFKHVVFRIIAGLVLLCAVAGIAFMAFNAGVAQGVALNLHTSAVTAGQALPVAPYGMPYMHPFFGFGIFGAIFGLFLLFTVLSAVRHLVWGPRMGWHSMRHFGRGDWHGNGGEGNFVHPMFAEMHRRAHEQAEKPAGTGEQK